MIVLRILAAFLAAVVAVGAASDSGLHHFHVGAAATARELRPAQPAAQTAPAPSVQLPAANRIQAVRQYIRRTWTLLTRSVRDLPRAAPDPKMHRAAGDS